MDERHAGVVANLGAPHLVFVANRVLRRVPLDFTHPVGETWPGYLPSREEAGQCLVCDGSGNEGSRDLVEAIAHLLLVAGDSAARGRARLREALA